MQGRGQRSRTVWVGIAFPGTVGGTDRAVLTGSGGDPTVNEDVPVVVAQQIGADGGDAMDAQGQDQPVHARRHLREA
jgi:hypothetical protein